MMDQEIEVPIYEKITLAQRALLTVIIITGSFMAILDTTVMQVIVPKIMAPLSTDIYGVQWVVTSYMIAAATGLLLVNNLSRSLGIKRVFITGLLFFTVASFMCGRVHSLGEMIVFRTIQGMGEALIVATAQTMLFTIYPLDKRGLAMGIYSLSVSFAPAMGPTLGGYITDQLNWRYVFYINVPIGILNIVAAAYFIPRLVKKREKFGFNYISFLFISLATISLLTLLSKGQEKGWFQSMFIIKLTITAASCFLCYIIYEIISRKPLIDFSIFKITEFRAAIGIFFFILGFSMYQVFYLLPFYYERLRFLSTFQTGLHLMPMALTVAVFSIISGILSDKIGPEKVLIPSAVILIWGINFVLPQLNYYTPKFKSVFMTLPFAVGVGMFFAPVTTLALTKLGDRTNLGVCLMQYTRFIGGSFGTALATNTLQRRIAFHYDEICGMQARNFYYIQQFMNKLLVQVLHFSPAEIAAKKVKALLGYVTNVQAMSYAFQDTFRESIIFVIIGCIFLALFFIEKKSLNHV